MVTPHPSFVEAVRRFVEAHGGLLLAHREACLMAENTKGCRFDDGRGLSAFWLDVAEEIARQAEEIINPNHRTESESWPPSK